MGRFGRSNYYSHKYTTKTSICVHIFVSLWGCMSRRWKMMDFIIILEERNHVDEFYFNSFYFVQLRGLYKYQRMLFLKFRLLGTYLFPSEINFMFVTIHRCSSKKNLSLKKSFSKLFSTFCLNSIFLSMYSLSSNQTDHLILVLGEK